MNSQLLKVYRPGQLVVIMMCLSTDPKLLAILVNAAKP
jgi:hypothetical protein